MNAHSNAYCVQCQTDFEITQSDQEFYLRLDVPAPQLCPSCRLQRRMAFRNERALYQRTCDATGKPIISIHRPDQSYPVYDQTYWWSDKWDALSYGREYDFSKSLSQQLKELYTVVPHIALYTINATNSEYTNYALNMKDSYLVFGASNDEQCMYGKFVISSLDTVDALSVYSCELCYEAIASERCYDCKFVTNCKDCHNSMFIEECQGCSDCFMCFGLRNKQYCILNEYVGKEQYEAFMQRYQFMSREDIAGFQQQFSELKKNLPHRSSHIYGSENCSGDLIINSSNCKSCFDINECENCSYVSNTPHGKDSYDAIFTSPRGVELCYNVCSTQGARECMSTFLVWDCANVAYSLECHNSNDVFACVVVRNGQYCILNKQYSKNKYEALRAKIVQQLKKTGEWGDYLAQSITPFGYNETIAQEYFPLTQPQAEALGYQWYTEPVRAAQPGGIVLPQTINQVTEDIAQDILQKPLTCEQCSKQYKIIPKELEFYRRIKLPVPANCPDCRHQRRIAMRGPYQLWKRTCACNQTTHAHTQQCTNEFETNYSPERTERVYCEECYKKEIY